MTGFPNALDPCPPSPREKGERSPAGGASMNDESRQPARDFSSFTDQELFLNRELSQLEFNFRVLAQAEDASLPLLERLRYLCIVSNNLDEFFEVRVASL